MAAVKNVTVIPARKRVGNTVTTESKPKLKVAAYCRVSTDSEEQATSYDAQVEHYTKFIKKNSEWEFVGIYADDGISGTNTKKREEFNRMIDDCMAGKIDMVITKSISRFARNTLDCLKFIRQLKEKNIPVFFEKENINTMDSKGEVLLTIMASLAQQESESLSKNVKMGLQFRYQNGQVQINHNWFLGYTKDENGHLIIDEEQAVIVRRIFREYLQGASLQNIARGLMADGIPTATGNKTWRGDGIRKILTNEKYMGDALLQKTYTVDVLTKKRVANNGIVPQYYVENNHEAIIPRELFMQVQEELQRRAHLRTEDGKTKRVYSSKYALSSIVYCGKCGDLFRRVAWKARGASYNKWRCASRIEKGPKKCDAEAISEKELQNAVVRAINKTLGGREEFLLQLQHNIEDVLNGDNTATLEYIDRRTAELQERLIMCVSKNTEYDTIANEIDALREKKATVLSKNAEQDMLIKRINEMRYFLQTQTSRITEYDELLVRRLIEKITVYDDKLIFEFKSGMTIDLKR
ncbi:MAG: recombinase family protein [Ruminococcus sp.]